MSTLDDFVVGKCLQMCPEEEIKWREKEKMLHVLEMVPGTEKSKNPKADRNRAIKSFSRSAAGTLVNNPNNLRPPDILLQTVGYLMFHIIDEDHIPWHSVCHFITDRLMSVRQDLVVQNIPKPESIAILQPIIRFHLYAASRLSSEKLRFFDPAINNNHIQECLKKILSFYDAYDDLFNNGIECSSFLVSRPELEALYIVFNLGSEEALRRFLTLPKSCQTNTVKQAFELSIQYKRGNFVRTCRLMQQLPTLVAATAALHLPKIRKRAFETMSNAYHNKTLHFPLSLLKEILLYESCSQLVEDCDFYNITTEEENVFFNKQTFKKTNKLVPHHHNIISRELERKKAQDLLLLGVTD